MKLQLFILFLAFSFVCLGKKKSKKDKDAANKLDYLSPAYEHHGICPSNFDKAYKYLCLPYKYVTYDNLFNPKFLEPAIDQFNVWMLRNPYWQEQVEARAIEENGIKRIGLFAIKEFPKYMKAYIMNEFDNFGFTNTTKDDFIEEFWDKIEEHEAFPQIEWNTTQQQLTFALLYHLYWSDFSMYQHIFRLFPPKPQIPLFTLTYYEVKLLEGDEAFNVYMNTYDEIMLGYNQFNSKLHEYWSDEQIESFYKGFDTIPIDDYVYIQNIIKRYSLSLKWVDDYDKNITHWTSYIPFAAMFMNGQIEKSKIGFRSDLDKKNKITYYFLTIEEKIDVDEELSIQFNYDRLHIESRKDDPTYWYFIMHGIVPDENEQDCIDVPLIDPSLGATYGVPHVACVSPHNAKLLMYQAVGNLMNMYIYYFDNCNNFRDQKDYDECNELVYNNQIRFFGPEDEKKFIYDVCVHPDWKKVDIWDQALEEIDEKLKMYKNKIKKTKKYLELRKKIEKSTLNAEMILKYMEARRELLRDVKYQVEALQLSPKKYKAKVGTLAEDDTELPEEMQGKFKPRFPERYEERKKERQYEMEQLQKKAKQNEEKIKLQEEEGEKGEQNEESENKKEKKGKKKQKTQKNEKIEENKEKQIEEESILDLESKEKEKQEL